MFNVELWEAADISRRNDGVPYAWTNKKQIAQFKDVDELKKYIKHNLEDLTNVVIFSSSATLISAANSYLTDKLKEASLL